MDRVQTYLERTVWGRTLISVFIVATVSTIILTNLPDSALEDATAAIVDPYVNATGLGQNWGVFSPNPRRISIDLHARITYTDGVQETWELPDPGPGLGTYRRYRWRKWADRVRLDANEGALWSPTARWLARIHERSGRDVARVELIRLWYDIPPPGSRDDPDEWNRYTFFTLERPGAGS